MLLPTPQYPHWSSITLLSPTTTVMPTCFNFLDLEHSKRKTREKWKSRILIIRHFTPRTLTFNPKSNPNLMHCPTLTSEPLRSNHLDTTISPIREDGGGGDRVVQPRLPIYHKSLKDTMYFLYVRWADARVWEVLDGGDEQWHFTWAFGWVDMDSSMCCDTRHICCLSLVVIHDIYSNFDLWFMVYSQIKWLLYLL